MACPSFSEKCCAYSISTKKMIMTTRTTDRVTRLPNTWWKFMSTSKPKLMSNLQENTYFITSMEREKRGSKATKAKAVTSEVEIAQIAYLIEKMNSDKSLPKNTMKLLSFNCEKAARPKIFVCPGWHKFAIDLGLKPMPE